MDENVNCPIEIAPADTEEIPVLPFESSIVVDNSISTDIPAASNRSINGITSANVTAVIEQKVLVGVPPKKQIFVSRLAPDTTSDDVKAFIQAKYKANVTVEKFKFTYLREISSFKISVTAEHFNKIC